MHKRLSFIPTRGKNKGTKISQTLGKQSYMGMSLSMRKQGVVLLFICRLFKCYSCIWNCKSRQKEQSKQDYRHGFAKALSWTPPWFMHTALLLLPFTAASSCPVLSISHHHRPNLAKSARASSQGCVWGGCPGCTRSGIEAHQTHLESKWRRKTASHKIFWALDFSLCCDQIKYFLFRAELPHPKCQKSSSWELHKMCLC